MRRRYAEYRPARWYRRRFRLFRLFRSGHPGAVGWAVLGAVCLAGAALGYGVALVTGLPAAPSAVAGALTVFLTVVAVDRRQWRRSWTGYSWGATPETTRRAGDELRRAGVEVTVEDRGGIRFRNRDRRRVGRVLTGLGIRPPRLW